MEALIDGFKQQINVFWARLVFKGQYNTLLALCLELEPVKRRHKDAITLLQCSFKDVISNLN